MVEVGRDLLEIMWSSSDPLQKLEGNVQSEGSLWCHLPTALLTTQALTLQIVSRACSAGGVSMVTAALQGLQVKQGEQARLGKLVDGAIISGRGSVTLNLGSSGKTKAAE